MTRIPLGHSGLCALIDDADAARVLLHSWRWNPARRMVYAIIAGRSVLLHRFILDAPDGLEVDHIHGERLDNRRRVIRLCSHAQNNQNRRVFSRSKTGVRGVTFRSDIGAYRSVIYVNGRQVNLGHFDHIGQAVAVRDAAAMHYHGEFARMTHARL